MSGGGWITIPNWDDYQHPDTARGLTPPRWIKLFVHLLDDDDFLSLSPTRRALFVGLLLEYARTRRKLPEDTATLSRRLAQRVTTRDLESLNRAGLIAISASKPQDESGKVARLDKRREELHTYEVGSSSLPSHSYPPERDSAEGGLALGLSDEVHRIAAEAAGNSHRPEPPPSPPPSSKSSSVFERAEAFTRQVGLEYPERDFLEELEQRFKSLTPAERERLFEIWVEVSPEATDVF